MSGRSTVRIEIGESAIFTRVYIDGEEVRGITRVWFDSGDVDAGDRPRKAWRDTTRVHIEMIPSHLEVTGETTVDALLAVAPQWVKR